MPLITPTLSTDHPLATRPRLNRRDGASWVIAACVALVLSGATFVTSRSPYQPVARATVGAHAYQLAADHANAPALYLLFACDTSGLLCRQVAAYAPFDLASGQHVAGLATLTPDTTHRALILRLGTSIIGIYHPSA